MPELPDVEMFRRYIGATSLHQKIASVTVRDRRLLKDLSTRHLEQTLAGRAFEATARHGKFLFAAANGSAWLVLHFGMSGNLDYGKRREAGRHDRVIFHFTNEYSLAYVSQRRLGRVALTPAMERFVEENDLGPDAMDIDCADFASRIRGSKAAVKSSLMNQRLVAGVGNIYSDEVLFQSRISPALAGNKLSEKQAKHLCRIMQRVLHAAVDRGADPTDFPASWLLPNRKQGRSCPRCAGRIRKQKVAGRSAYWCPGCQQT
jgi:formamidopyrimidine-DNA glycosylase